MMAYVEAYCAPATQRHHDEGDKCKVQPPGPMLVTDPSDKARVLANCIEWDSDGTAICIRCQETLMSTVVPLFFHTTKKFKSFTRKLYRWGFRLVKANLPTWPDSMRSKGSIERGKKRQTDQAGFRQEHTSKRQYNEWHMQCNKNTDRTLSKSRTAEPHGLLIFANSSFLRDDRVRINDMTSHSAATVAKLHSPDERHYQDCQGMYHIREVRPWSDAHRINSVQGGLYCGNQNDHSLSPPRKMQRTQPSGKMAAAAKASPITMPIHPAAFEMVLNGASTVDWIHGTIHRQCPTSQRPFQGRERLSAQPLGGTVAAFPPVAGLPAQIQSLLSIETQQLQGGLPDCQGTSLAPPFMTTSPRAQSRHPQRCSSVPTEHTPAVPIGSTVDPFWTSFSDLWTPQNRRCNRGLSPLSGTLAVPFGPATAFPSIATSGGFVLRFDKIESPTISMDDTILPAPFAAAAAAAVATTTTTTTTGTGTTTNPITAMRAGAILDQRNTPRSLCLAARTLEQLQRQEMLSSLSYSSDDRKRRNRIFQDGFHGAAPPSECFGMNTLTPFIPSTHGQSHVVPKSSTSSVFSTDSLSLGHLIGMSTGMSRPVAASHPDPLDRPNPTFV